MKDCILCSVLAYIRIGQPQSALSLLAEILTVEPFCARSLCLRAKINLLLNGSEEAAADIKRLRMMTGQTSKHTSSTFAYSFSAVSKERKEKASSFQMNIQ